MTPDVLGTAWRNTEYRSFNFIALGHHTSISSSPSNPADGKRHEVEDWENATLRETAESRQRRGKSEAQPGREKQARLFKAALQGCDDQGLSSPNNVEKDDRHGEEGEGLAGVINEGSQNEDKRDGEAPATDRSGDTAADADAADKEKRKSKGASVTALTASTENGLK